MNTNFLELISDLNARLKELQAMEPVVAAELLLDTPVGGVYVFIENGTPLLIVSVEYAKEVTNIKLIISFSSQSEGICRTCKNRHHNQILVIGSVNKKPGAVTGLVR
jgi:hypothetical protein